RSLRVRTLATAWFADRQFPEGSLQHRSRLRGRAPPLRHRPPGSGGVAPAGSPASGNPFGQGGRAGARSLGAALRPRTAARSMPRNAVSGGRKPNGRRTTVGLAARGAAQLAVKRIGGRLVLEIGRLQRPERVAGGR